tara:strand:+ start:137 stop:412 length:276 start_codon:yes stop_codon:yes gene_type:complete
MISFNYELGGYSMIVSKGGSNFYTEMYESDIVQLIQEVLESSRIRSRDLLLEDRDSVLSELVKAGKKAGDILQDRECRKILAKKEGSADNG